MSIEHGEPAIESFRPISNYVVLEKTQHKPSETISEGGIVIPSVAAKGKNEHQIGTILAIGPGQLIDNGERIRPQFNVGDTVVYDPYKGRVVNPRISLYELILPADAVLAVLEGPLE